MHTTHHREGTPQKITHHTPHITGLRLNPQEQEESGKCIELRKRKKADGEMSGLPHLTRCNTRKPQAAQFLFFLGGFFFSFIKKRKSCNHSTLRIMCDAQPSELTSAPTTGHRVQGWRTGAAVSSQRRRKRISSQRKSNNCDRRGRSSRIK